MRGGAAGDEGAMDHPPPPTLPPVQPQGGSAPVAHKSPPLSAAPSQVSLAPSDLTTSDPDLSHGGGSLASSSVSLASTSRPPSSSSGLASPDLAPHPHTDITHAVEEEEEENDDDVTGNSNAVPESDASSQDHRLNNSSDVYMEDSITGGYASIQEKKASATDADIAQSITSADDEASSAEEGSPKLNGGERALKVSQQYEGEGSDTEEDYFEEYHLPNTHENAFVRHCSFRRKVELTPINAPDAQTIEDLVRNGEYERHGSIRRKIVSSDSALPENSESGLCKLEEGRATHSGPISHVGEFSEDFREIEKLMNDETVDEEAVYLADKVAAGNNEQLRYDDTLLNPRTGLVSNDTPKLLMRGKNTFTSTPNNVYASTADYASIDLSASLHDNSHTNRNESIEFSNEPESLSIELSTLNKVKECMDFSKTREMYNLTGKLQDMLTAVEVEEVLNNSHRYTDYIDSGVLEALFNTISEQMSMTGQPMSISFNKHDLKHKAIKEKRKLTEEELELERKIKQKLLMEELAMDSLPYINVQSPEESVSTVNENIEESETPVVMRKKKGTLEGSDGESSRYSTIERRKSIKINAGQNQIEVEGVFVESDFKDSKLKTIPAPSIDLMNSGSQDDLDISDLDSRSYDESLDLENTPGNTLLEVTGGATLDDLSQISIPSIRITRTESSKEGEQDNSSVSNLYIVDESTDNTSLEYNPTEEYGACRPANQTETESDDSRHLTTDGATSHRKPLSKTAPRRVSPPPNFLAELSAAEEQDEERHWRSVVIGGIWRRIDMKCIAPYIKCISPGGHHAGYAVVVVSACQLPVRTTPDYAYVMDNLFLYILSRLEQLVCDDYILVYLSGGRIVTQTGPNFHWLKAAYQMIDRKLRKNLQALLVVHPSLWVRTIVALTRPFISSKFYRKLTFVYSLTELAQLIPLDQLAIPDSVKEADFELMIREKKRNVARRPRPAALS
uniref:Protein prune homolog 2-like isoform X1 n=1 Tax=Hirondellea gigas TaxID=1518452 RepID=A0A6A7FX31_9CRUS